MLLDFLRAGDTLVVTRIDRLARSLKDLQDIVHELKARSIALKASEHPVLRWLALSRAGGTGLAAPQVHVPWRLFVFRISPGRTEEDLFRCLAWLYDGFDIPARLGSSAPIDRTN